MYELVENNGVYTLLSDEGWVLIEGSKSDAYYYLQDQGIDEDLILSIIK